MTRIDNNLVEFNDLKKGKTYYLPGDYWGSKGCLINTPIKITSKNDKIAYGITDDNEECQIFGPLFKEKYMKPLPTFEEIISMAPQGIISLLEDCENTPQSKTWHPEGNVLIHTRIVYNRAREDGNLDLALSALFHDLGKASTTKKNKKGDWSAYGHEYVSAKIVENYKSWIEELGGDADKIKEIVTLHMRVKFLGEMKPAKQEIMRSNPVFEDLQKFSTFDSMRTLTDDELEK